MQKTKLPNLITLLVLTLVTVLMWIGFTIFRAITTAPEPSVPQDVSQTLSPALDTVTLNKVKSGLFFSTSQIPQVTFSASPTPVVSQAPRPTPQVTPIASPSASPIETLVPTPTPAGP